MKQIPTSHAVGVLTPKFRNPLVLLAAAFALCHSARAAQDTWSPTAGTTAWATGSNWTGGVAPTNDLTTDTALFNSASYASQPNTGTRSVAGVEVGGSSGTLTISGTAFSLGGSGLQVDSGAGTVTLSPTTVNIGASQNWANNSSSLLTVSSKVTNSGTNSPFILTFNGTGSGGTTVSGVISNGGGTSTTALVINTGAGGPTTLSATNTFTGGVTLTSGTLNINKAGALGATGSTFTINGGTFDNTSGAAFSVGNNAQAWNSNVTFGGTNALTFGTGAITLGVSSVTVTNSGAALLTESGAITSASASALVLNASSTGGITLGAVNNTGLITNSGGGSGTITISGVIGTAVTGVIQNSATSQLSLGGTNTFTSGLTVDQGTVLLTASAAAGASATSVITLGSSTGGSASVLLNSNITVANAINLATGALGTLTLGTNGATGGTSNATFSGSIALDNDNLILASNSSSYALVQSGILSGTGNLSLTGVGAVTLGGANTFTGNINVLSGDLILKTTTALGNSANLLTLSAGTEIDGGNNNGETSFNPVTILGNFSYGSSFAQGITGALTMPSNITITIGSSTGAGTPGRALTLGATSLGGATLTVQSTLSAVSTTAISSIVLGAVNLTGNQTFNVTNATTSNDFIELSLGTITDTGSGSNITKTGSGILFLGGSAASNLSGAIDVQGGSLGISVAGSAGELGTATITLHDGTAMGRMDTGGSPGTASNAVVIQPNAAVSLYDTGNGITFSGPFTVGSGAFISLQTPFSANTNGVTISGPISLGGNLTLSAPENGKNGTTLTSVNLNVTGAIKDAVGTTGDGITINTTNTGALASIVTLNNAGSTFDGGVTLTSGSLALGNSSTLSGSAVINGSAGTGTLTLNGGSIGFTGASLAGTPTSYINNTLVINGTVEFGGSATNGLANNAMIFGGAVTIDGGSVLTSPTGATANSVAFNSTVIPLSVVTLAGNITVKPSSGSTFIFDDAIGESVTGSGITIGDGTTTGTVVMGTNTGNPNTYSGATTVLSGVLQLDVTNALQDSTLVTNSTAGSTIFDQSVGSHAFTFGGLSGNGNLALQDNAGAPNAVALSTGNNNANTTYGGVLSGSGSLAKIGTGTMTVTNANTYTGGTIISSGNFAVDNLTGSGTGTGAVQVNGGALGGTGTINTSSVTTGKAVDIAAGAMLSPSSGVTTGFSHLTLALQSGTSVTLESGSKLAFNLGASTATSDEILITGGTLALNGQNFSDFTFNAQGTLAPGLYTLIDSAGGITGLLGTTSGSFDGGLFNGTLFMNGNDLDLQVTEAVPEPGTWAMMLGGLALLVVIQRSRKQKQG